MGKFITIFDEILEHEKRLIGALLSDPDNMEYVMTNKITPDLFYIDNTNEDSKKESEFLKKIFRVIRECHEGFGISDANVIDKFKLKDKEKISRFQLELQKYKMLARNKADFFLACQKIQSCKMTSDLFAISETIVDMAGAKYDGHEIFDLVFTKILDMNQFNDEILEYNAKEASEQTMTDVKRRIRGEVSDGVKSHIPSLDKEIKCFYYGMPSLVVARPGHCKSTLMLNAFLNNIENNEKPTYISLEMPAVHIMLKIISAKSGIPLRRILNPISLIVNDKVDEFQILEDTIKWFGDKEFYIVDAAGLTVNQLFIYMNKYLRKGSKVAYVDYFQRLLLPNGKMPGKAEEYSEVCKIATKSIKVLNRKGNMAFVLGVQAGRVEHRPINDRLPKLSDLQWTSALEQDAVVIMSLMNPEKYEGDDCTRKNVLVVGFPKHRYENAVQTELSFLGEIQKIGDLKNAHRVEKDIEEWKKEVREYNQKREEREAEKAAKKAGDTEKSVVQDT